MGASEAEGDVTRAQALRALEQAAMRYAAMVRGPESWPPVEHDGVIGARARVMIACKSLYEATPEGERHG